MLVWHQRSTDYIIFGHSEFNNWISVISSKMKSTVLATYIMGIGMISISVFVFLYIIIDTASGNLPDSPFVEYRNLLVVGIFEDIVNYCYEHADRPNPVQDLLDKGLISDEFNDETCESIKLEYDKMTSYLR